MDTKFQYNVNFGGNEWENQVEILDMDQNRKHIFLMISATRGMSYFVILNIHENEVVLTIPYHDLGLMISPPNDPEYLFLKLREEKINPIDVNNIVWGISRVWNELFSTNE